MPDSRRLDRAESRLEREQRYNRPPCTLEELHAEPLAVHAMRAVATGTVKQEQEKIPAWLEAIKRSPIPWAFKDIADELIRFQEEARK